MQMIYLSPSCFIFTNIVINSMLFQDNDNSSNNSNNNNDNNIRNNNNGNGINNDNNNKKIMIVGLTTINEVIITITLMILMYFAGT